MEIPVDHKLFFTEDGMTLVDIHLSHVVLWDVPAYTPRCTFTGTFVGLSANGTHCLMSTPSGGVTAWETAQGTQVLLSQLAPNAFPLHQRVLITKPDPHTLEITDVFGLQSHRILVTYADISFGESRLLPRTPNERYIITHNSFNAGNDEGGSLAGYDLVSGQQVMHYGLRYCSSFDVSACPAQQVITVIYYRRGIALFDVGATAPPTYGEQLWDLSVGNEDVSAASVAPTDRSRCAVSLGQRIVIFTPTRQNRYPEYIASIWYEIDAGQQVLSMAFDPLGQRVAARLADRTIGVWMLRGDNQ
jgi:hypothetical protein